jgi:hypothetical protein
MFIFGKPIVAMISFLFEITLNEMGSNRKESVMTATVQMGMVTSSSLEIDVSEAVYPCVYIAVPVGIEDGNAQ